MKIIFNHNINNWYWQIYDEWSRNHEVILPEYYKDNNTRDYITDFNVLEKLIKENPDIDFIFDFKLYIPDLIRWKRKGITVPIIIFIPNVLYRPYYAKLSIYANVWYVNENATQFIERYNVNNLLYDGMAANPYVFYPIEMKKKYDISFFGRFYGDRSFYLREINRFCSQNNIKNYFPLGHGEDLPWSFDDINRLYNKTKINLSFAQRDYIGKKVTRRVNLRTFEICMSGNFQLLQYTPCVEEYFEVDEEIVCWRNRKDLFSKILYYLENEDEREKIAKKGYKRAIENHTWSKRLVGINLFLKNKELSPDISKNIVKIRKFLDCIEILKVPKKLPENFSKSILKLVLRKLGYRLKRDAKSIKIIHIKLKDRKVIYRPNLKDFIFIKLSGKIIMVIKVIPTNFKINPDEWDQLEEILYLIENYDFSLPQFGLLTNGYDWVIRDFKNRRWVSSIPTRTESIEMLNSNNIIKKVYLFIKQVYKDYELEKLFLIPNLECYFRHFLINIEERFRKLFNLLKF